MIVLDTPMLMYAVGGDHPLRSPCRDLIALVQDGTVRATTTVEVVQEFAHVRARRRTRQDAALLAERYADGLAPLLRPEREDLVDGMRIFSRSRSLGTFDAVLAAASRNRQWTLASADRAFGRVEALLHLDPSSRTFSDEVHRAG